MTWRFACQWVGIPGMYLAPERFTMSTYKIMGVHADALEHALEEANLVRSGSALQPAPNRCCRER
eukprot:9475736-Pyramimonas_sp.AAC.2